MGPALGAVTRCHGRDSGVPGRSGDDPLTACAALWGDERFGSAPAPPLVACVLDSGALAVFPGAGARLCADLELAPPDPEVQLHGDAAAGLRAVLVERFLDVACRDEAEATAIVRAVLFERGLDDWRVEPAAPFSAAQPCATLAFDVPGRRVLLVPSLPVGPDP